MGSGDASSSCHRKRYSFLTMSLIEHFCVSVPHGVVFLMDFAGGEIPLKMLGRLVAATSTCIAIGTRHGAEGETRFNINHGGAAVPGERKRAVVTDAVILTPTRELSLTLTDGTRVFSCATADDRARVTVRFNNRSEPDEIDICIY
ncbi:hypothetical protein BH11PLA1_BH11PLA1_20870 [soil metagenome]